MPLSHGRPCALRPSASLRSLSLSLSPSVFREVDEPTFRCVLGVYLVVFLLAQPCVRSQGRGGPSLLGAGRGAVGASADFASSSQTHRLR